MWHWTMNVNVIPLDEENDEIARVWYNDAFHHQYQHQHERPLPSIFSWAHLGSNATAIILAVILILV